MGAGKRMRKMSIRLVSEGRRFIAGALAGSALFLSAACGGGDGPSGGAAPSGTLCILNVDVPFFSYCAEYVGLTESQCTQSMGMYDAQCAGGYVGYCESAGNVNPRRTYFYGSSLTQQSVQSVCPGGKYVPGKPPGAGP
jgi:hypothetical protein